MKEVPTPRPDVRPARDGEIRSKNTSPTMPVQGDPTRRAFGDRTDDASRKSNPSSPDDERKQKAHQDGDKTDESDARDQGPYMKPTQSSGKDQDSGSTRQDQQKPPNEKFSRGHEPARKGPEAESDAKP